MYHIQGASVRVTANFSAKNVELKRQWRSILLLLSVAISFSKEEHTRKYKKKKKKSLVRKIQSMKASISSKTMFIQCRKIKEFLRLTFF